ncbi:MAG: HlyD family type I secretion periplasmic adaptor subunit [Pseudomonadota bacterium]
MSRSLVCHRFGDIQSPRALGIARSVHLIFLLLGSVFIAAALVLVIFKVEIVATGSAKLAHVGQAREIQAEFTLPVKEIIVANGDRVVAGQTLIRLEDTDIATQHARVVNEISETELRLQTLDFLLHAIDQVIGQVATIEDGSGQPSLPVPDAEDVRMQEVRPLVAELQASFFNGYQEVRLNLQEVDRIQETLPIYRTLLEKNRAIMSAASELRGQGNISQRQLLAAEAEFEAMRLDLQTAGQDIARAEDAIELIKSRLGVEFATRRASLANERLTFSSRLAELELEELRLRRQVDAAVLTAPTAGTVEYIEVFAPGELARAGQTLMSIVPDDEALILEAEVPNSDIGLLRAGQQANINFEAYPAARFGLQKGTLINVSTDARENASGQWVFAALIELDKEYVSLNGADYSLASGMTAQIEVVTGQRRLITYFAAPVVAVIQGSLGEF